MLASSDFIKAFTACLEERANGEENEEALLETNPNAVKEDAAEKGPEVTAEVALTSMEASRRLSSARTTRSTRR